jgi:hypothetical protein
VWQFGHKEPGPAEETNCAANVCFGPLADIGLSHFDMLFAEIDIEGLTGFFGRLIH